MYEHFSLNKMLSQAVVVLYFIHIVICQGGYQFDPHDSYDNITRIGCNLITAECPVKIQGDGNDVKNMTNTMKGIWEGVYEYYEGELIKFTCVNIQDHVLRVKISTTAHKYEKTYITTHKFKINPNDQIFLTVKLSRDNNDSNIMCTVGEKEVVKIKLKYGKTSDEATLDLPVTSKKCDIPDMIKKCYVLESYAQEDLSPMSKILRTNPSITCGNEILTRSTPLECNVSNNKKIEIKVVDNLAAMIMPRIIGLSMLKTLAMYSYNSSLFVILYEYYSEDQLELRCECKNNQFAEWSFNDTIVNNTMPAKANLKNNICEGSFIINQTHQFGEIVCKCHQQGLEEPKTISIRLVKQKQNKLDPLAPNSEPKNVTRWIVMGVIGIILLIIIVAVAFIIIKHNKAAKSPALLQDTPDPHGDSTINANDEIQYTVSYQPNEEESRSKPNTEWNDKITKEAEKDRDSKSDESLEIIDSDVETSEPTTTDVRKNDNYTSNEVTYAELSLKEPTSVRRKDNNESPYACLDLIRS